jgi:hypothetical protein
MLDLKDSLLPLPGDLSGGLRTCPPKNPRKVHTARHDADMAEGLWIHARFSHMRAGEVHGAKNNERHACGRPRGARDDE